MGHIAYYWPCESLVFVGYSLFTLGCGRMFFEGTSTQYWQSLQSLHALPDETTAYCAHEYTLANAKFAVSVEPNNIQLRNRYETIKELRENNQPTVPSNLGTEKRTNPFLRCDTSDEIRFYVGGTIQDTDAELFAKVRKAKDQFKG